MQTINNLRNSKKIRLVVIIILMILLVILYFRNVNTSNLSTVDGVQGELQAQMRPDTTEKKIFLGLFALMGAALGMEIAEKDIDLGKLIESKGDFNASKVLRNKNGDIITQEQIDRGEVKKENVKFTDEYNCDDFSTQEEAQNFYDKSGGVSKDTNRLDGDKNGVACQALPKK